jgi:hypothetical protein
MVNGEVMGTGSVNLAWLKNGYNEVLLEVAPGPICKDYKNIRLSLASACEYDIGGIGSTVNGMCIMDPPRLAGQGVTANFTRVSDAGAPAKPLCKPVIRSTATFAASWAPATTTGSRRTTESDDILRVERKHNAELLKFHHLAAESHASHAAERTYMLVGIGMLVGGIDII